MNGGSDILVTPAISDLNDSSKSCASLWLSTTTQLARLFFLPRLNIEGSDILVTPAISDLNDSSKSSASLWLSTTSQLARLYFLPRQNTEGSDILVTPPISDLNDSSKSSASLWLKHNNTTCPVVLSSQTEHWGVRYSCHTSRISNKWVLDILVTSWVSEWMAGQIFLLHRLYQIWMTAVNHVPPYGLAQQHNSPGCSFFQTEHWEVRYSCYTANIRSEWQQ